MAAAPNALQPVAWECGSCAHTNKGTEPGPCAGCAALKPVRYMIWRRPGGGHAPTTISARVNRPLQYSCPLPPLMNLPPQHCTELTLLRH